MVIESFMASLEGAKGKTDPRAALIKQLGEALGEAFALMNPQLDHIGEALNAYNNYLRERGE